MKYKRILFCFLFVVCVLSGSAQSTFQKERAIGVSGGVNFSKVNFVPKVTQNMLVGFNTGVMVRWRTESNLGLQVELNFKQEGWDEKFENVVAEDGTTEDYSSLYYRRKMNYLEVPFLSHIYFGGEKVQFFINLGPQIGFFIGDKEEENLGGVIPNGHENTQHGMDIEKKFEWGLCGGPGIELRTGIGSFLLEGRFFYALGDFYNTRKEDAFSKASSQVISAKLTYLIPF
ncbi:MAG: PorT family protein [Tannerella sp.]|jgi:hypothetical protein|nr:PorT family protein [Tannerella sp.]